MRVLTQPRAGASKEVMSLYAKNINMLDGLADKEVDRHLDEHPRIVPLFEVDVAEAVTPYFVQQEEVGEEPDRDAIRELRQAEEALEREMAVSQRVKVSQLVET